MAGICGLFRPRRASEPHGGIVDRMADALPYGGGDAAASLGAGTLGCAGSASLFVDQQAGIAAVVEGRPRLASDGSTDPDSAKAIARSYGELGDRFIDRLRGSFSLAILDGRAGRLLLAVDRMGTRPMCFARSADGDLLFASTTTAILAGGAIANTLSPQSLYHYLYFHVVPSPATIYEHIRKLQPAELLIASGESLDVRFYWMPPKSPARSGRSDELGARLVDNLTRAVERNVSSAGTGTFLSGGLDSSCISGLANRFVEPAVNAYSIGFAQQGYDEMEYARAAAAHFGLNHREYYVTPDDVADSIDVITEAYDEPFGNSSAIPAYHCARLARSEGLDTMLAGDGGDELFAGNERYATQTVFEYYHRLPRALRSRIVEPLMFGVPTDWSTFTRKARRYVEQARIEMPARLQTYNFLHMHEDEKIFHDEFAGRIEPESPVTAMRSWYDRYEDYGLIDRMLYFDWKLTLADNDLRKVNRMCEVAGIDVRYPFLDDDVVSFSTEVPSRLKIRSRHLRYFFKKSFETFLPAKVLAKQKHGFGLPFGDWLNTSERLRSVVLPGLERMKDRRILEPGFIDLILHKHRTEHAAHYGNMIWVIMILDRWLAANADGADRRRPT